MGYPRPRAMGFPELTQIIIGMRLAGNIMRCFVFLFEF